MFQKRTSWSNDRQSDEMNCRTNALVLFTNVSKAPGHLPIDELQSLNSIPCPMELHALALAAMSVGMSVIFAIEP